MFSTLAVYNGQRLFKADKLKKTPWLLWVKQQEKRLYLLVLGSSILSIVLLFMIQKLNFPALFILGITGFISVFYVIKLGKVNLREIPYIKIHLIAITWTIVLILFPIINEGINTSFIWICVAHYLYVVGVTIPFDIRDLKYDSPSQKTIPQVFGVKGSKFISVILLLVFSGVMYSLYPELIWNWLFCVSVVVQLLLILLMSEKRSDIYCAGGIDGAIALLGLSYFM